MSGMLRLIVTLALGCAFLLLADDLLPHDHAHAHGGACAHDASRWHPPVDATGCAYGHEHGDAPPAWIAEAGYQAGFDQHAGFHGNTTPAENTAKHTSMKGMLATFAASGQTVYMRVHIASNQLERGSRYHSYEMFLRDAAGRVSHWQGWMNSGDPVTSRRSKSLNDNGQRPLVLVTDVAALQHNLTCEQWYGFTSIEGWGPDIGWTICGSTTMYFAQENQYPDYWYVLCDYGYPSPTCKGADRELELAWYGPGSLAAPNRGNPPKDVEFWATQFGARVTSQNDPRCAVGQTTERFGQAYQNVCLSQYIASTARAIENLPTIPNANRYRKLYDVSGVGSVN